MTRDQVDALREGDLLLVAGNRTNRHARCTAEMVTDSFIRVRYVGLGAATRPYDVLSKDSPVWGWMANALRV